MLRVPAIKELQWGEADAPVLESDCLHCRRDKEALQDTVTRKVRIYIPDISAGRGPRGLWFKDDLGGWQ